MDIHEENQKLTMWCEDKTIFEDFHKYAEEQVFYSYSFSFALTVNMLGKSMVARSHDFYDLCDHQTHIKIKEQSSKFL